MNCVGQLIKKLFAFDHAEKIVHLSWESNKFDHEENT